MQDAVASRCIIILSLNNNIYKNFEVKEGLEGFDCVLICMGYGVLRYSVINNETRILYNLRCEYSEYLDIIKLNQKLNEDPGDLNTEIRPFQLWFFKINNDTFCRC